MMMMMSSSSRPDVADHLPGAGDLPVEILQSIHRFLHLVDYIRFAAVCTSWRSAAKCNPHPPKPEPMPWLFFFSDHHTAFAIRFSPENHKKNSHSIYRMPIPVPESYHPKHFVRSSSDHCLILETEDSRSHSIDVCFVNPFSSWDQIARLPYPRRRDVLQRIATDGSLAVALVGSTTFHIAYTKLGASPGGRWIDLYPLTKTKSFKDVVAAPSRPGLFYVVRNAEPGTVIVAALHFSSSDSSSSSPLPTVKFEDISLNLLDDYINKENSVLIHVWLHDMRLVVSSSALFLVRWRLMVRVGDRGEREKIKKGDVYNLQLDESPDKRRWVSVRTLGECSFFLGNNQSISLSSLEFPQLRSNRIYLPCYPYHSWKQWDEDGVKDLDFMSIYNMGDDSWVPLYGFDDQSYMDFFGPDSWITPHFVWITPRLV